MKTQIQNLFKDGRASLPLLVALAIFGLIQPARAQFSYMVQRAPSPSRAIIRLLVLMLSFPQRSMAPMSPASETMRFSWQQPDQRYDPQQRHQHRSPERSDNCTSLTSVTIRQQRHQHRNLCVLLLHQPDQRHDSQQRHQHRRLCVSELHQPDQRHDRQQRHQHRKRCVLHLHQPDQRHDSQQRHQHRNRCVL